MPQTEWTYRLRFIHCGKTTCWCYGSAYGHGPYWYGHRWRNGRRYEKYFGARPTSEFTMPPQSESYRAPEPESRWTLRGKMTLKTALRIFAITRVTTAADLRSRWYALVLEHHPDRGGDTAICQAINAAYQFLKPLAH